MNRPIKTDGLMLVATAAGKLAERDVGQFLANPAADILYESGHTVNGIVISAKVYATTKHEGKQPKWTYTALPTR
jgi:hypothetical protein